jgi:hypothetical protein
MAPKPTPPKVKTPPKETLDTLADPSKGPIYGPGATAPVEVEIARKRGALAMANANKANSGAGGNQYKNMLATLQKLGNYSAGNINESMNDLSSFLQGQKNPYANFQAQNTQTTPDFAQLLQSQGVNQDPLQQFASAINTQNRGQADAFQNQANTMRDIYGANQLGSVGDVESQRAQLINSLQANTFGTGAALMGKKAPDRNAIMQMILAMLGKGGMK